MCCTNAIYKRDLQPMRHAGEPSNRLSNGSFRQITVCQPHCPIRASTAAPTGVRLGDGRGCGPGL